MLWYLLNFFLFQKERSRLSEVGEEASQLETRIVQLKKMLGSMK